MRVDSLIPVFVEQIPDALEEGHLYISVQYATAIHKCPCGCGHEVVTPLSPTDWRLVYDGETISLDPSVGNWSFSCQSHYWITRNRVRTAPQWSRERIEAGREADRAAKVEHFDPSTLRDEQQCLEQQGSPWWQRAWSKLRGES